MIHDLLCDEGMVLDIVPFGGIDIRFDQMEAQDKNDTKEKNAIKVVHWSFQNR